MVTQILNIFDPGTSNRLQINWILLTLPFIFPYMIKHFSIRNYTNNFTQLTINTLCSALTPLRKLTTPFVFTCFAILSWNLRGLLPFNFTVTTQFILTISLALPLWSTPFFNSLITKYWWPSHLTPANLPALALAIFMSWVELIRCFLRPLTLSLRLMINLTAGHLILSLVALAQSTDPRSTYIIIGLIMFLFIVLEIAVAFIQAYVFRMLTLLYSKEN